MIRHRYVLSIFLLQGARAQARWRYDDHGTPPLLSQTKNEKLAREVAADRSGSAASNHDLLRAARARNPTGRLYAAGPRCACADGWRMPGCGRRVRTLPCPICIIVSCVVDPAGGC
jgi:hypothetical protein